MSEQHVSLRDFFDEKFSHLDRKADQIIDLQKTTNGRLRAAEKAIAVLSWAYGVAVVVIGWLVTEVVKP